MDDRSATDSSGGGSGAHRRGRDVRGTGRVWAGHRVFGGRSWQSANMIAGAAAGVAAGDAARRTGYDASGSER